MLISARWWSASAAILTFAGRLGGAQSPTTGRADAVLPGCYRITLGPWSKASSLGPAQPTAVIRLDTIAFSSGDSDDLVAERIEPAEFAPPGDVRLRWQHPARWRRVGADSVVIVAWSTGTEAEVFYGRLEAGTLHGVMRRTSDAIPIDPTTRRIQWDVWPWASASAVGIRCP
jgi:hypothetical protein